MTKKNNEEKIKKSFQNTKSEVAKGARKRKGQR